MHVDGDEEWWGLTRDEAWALGLGVAVVLASLAGLALTWLLDPDVGRGLLLQGIAHVAVGRESGLPVGLANGVPPWLAGLAAFAQNAVVLLVGYGVVGLAARGALGQTRLGRRLAARVRAPDVPRRGEAAGVLALAGSLWVPLLPTGALAAALAGRAAGYRAGRLLGAIVVSAFAADLAYAYALYGAADAAGGPSLLWLLAAAAAVAGAGAALVRRRRRLRGKEVTL